MLHPADFERTQLCATNSVLGNSGTYVGVGIGRVTQFKEIINEIDPLVRCQYVKAASR